MTNASTGGGAATQGGTNYQNKVAAWFAVRALAEQGACAPWGLPVTATVDLLRCETTEPVDDILVGLSNEGHVFIQAKHTITFGTKKDSKIADVFDQFVRQYHSYDTTKAEPTWARPLDEARDRLILATTSGASTTITQGLPKLLDRLSKLAPKQPFNDAAASKIERKTLAVLKTHISRPWKRIKGTKPTTGEMSKLASLIRIQILDVDPGEQGEREALDLLQNTVLKSPTDSTAAWKSIFEACATFAADRTGTTRRQLQDRLVAESIDLRVPTSYREDVQILKRHSELTLSTIEPLSEIRLVGNPKVKVVRESTAELKTCAKTGHVIVLGQPGAGKSGALHDLAKTLAPDGDVLLFAVANYEAKSLGGLRTELGCSHDIVEVLRNWPGAKPGFLIIDALDAARTEMGARTFRELIGLLMGHSSRWRVITSIRKYDLRYSQPLQQLFKGAPPSKFFDPEFKAITHIEIPVLSDAELEQVKTQSSQLKEILQNATPSLLTLLKVPFNLKLIAELVTSGVNVSTLTPIRSQIELLERYWQERVIGSDNEGDAREAVLRTGTEAMVTQRSLRIDRATIAHDVSASKPLSQVMSSHIIVEWQPDPDSLPERNVITFSHHILFDYSVARLVFRGVGNKVLAKLEAEPDLLLAVRPSVIFHFQYLWGLDRDHNRFWNTTFEFFTSSKVPSLGKIIGPIVASQMFQTVPDCDPLLRELKDDGSNNHQASVDAFRHMLGALKSAGTDDLRPLAGPEAPPWCALLEQVSRI